MLATPSPVPQASLPDCPLRNTGFNTGFRSVTEGPAQAHVSIHPKLIRCGLPEEVWRFSEPFQCMSVRPVL